MTVDVDACIGCQACAIACHAENNVPIVGKAQAAYGRQVSWLRVERWADGAADRRYYFFFFFVAQKRKTRRQRVSLAGLSGLGGKA